MRRSAVLVGLALTGCGGAAEPGPKVTRAGQLHQPGPPVHKAALRVVTVPATAGSETRADGLVRAAGASCGRERWDVKTATDAGAAQIKLAPVPASVAELGTLPSTNNGNLDQPRTGAEFTVYEVTAELVEAKSERDGDFHLVLHGSTGSMIAEIPSAPACTVPPITQRVSALELQIESARAAFVREFGEPSSTSWLPIHHQVTVTGVFFDDALHGQSGVAPNGAELHPLLSVLDP